MKFFIDTANLNQIREAQDLGVLDGVTTNPSLIKAAMSKDVSMEDYIMNICTIAGKGKPVSLEVVSLDAKNMVDEADLLYKKFNEFADNVVIKIPVSTNTGDGKNYDGLNAIKKLSEKGVPVNATLVMTPEQAFLAAKMGAKYVSPFAGRPSS